ncbi:peptidoglycan editing factor PgeF [Enhygromyxa salina]|uniref:Purine nucleoside phosphorylase n=1 Tax=Enhygromyxa salina TaxID=215803 RepID=A0A2S9YII7_9BACT|nr:peptidoglycan editing factor PgeF [Enhygromyxa salina]PRQ04871.1 Laccase domain protein YfiH [Enhygromyxa salina]
MLQRAQLFPAEIIHGFSTRIGGVSQDRYASLNVGERWGDDPEAVAENLRRIASLAQFELEQLVRVRQVHGVGVLAAHELTPDSEADALWHARAHPGPAKVVGVMTADCVPVLICDRDASVVAAIHSGWRGTVANITGRTVQTLCDEGDVAPVQLLAAIGPCIELPAFEVGEEVAAEFEDRFVDRSFGAKPHVDLVACVRAQLIQAGVPAAQIERVGSCTHANPDLYFSYRLDGAGIGQHLSLIGLR